MSEGMTTTGVSLGDAMLMCNGRNGCGYGDYNNMWNNPFMYLIWLAMFNGGNAFGWNNGNCNGNGAITNAHLDNVQSELQNAIYASNDQQTLMNMIRSLGNGVADLGYANSNLARDTQQVVGDTGNRVVAALNGGFERTISGINDNKFAAQANTFALQQSLCNLNHNVDALRFDNEKNASRIAEAIHLDGQATRALIEANVVQDLRDRLAAQSQELQNAHFAISQAEQNQYLISALKGGCGCNCG